VYADAFDGGFKADVVYRNTKAGIEQNILIHEQLPSPDSFGLNPANTRLQVMTEFVNPPTPQITQAKMADGTIVDQMIEFGQMCISQGQAFLLDTDLSSLPGGIPLYGFPVNKHWLLVNNRHILVEDVPFPMVLPQLQQLPPPSGGSSTNHGANAGGLLHKVFAQLQLPPAPKRIKPSGETMKYAAMPSEERGFVLDYGAISSSMTNVTFQSDTTYYINGPVDLYGTTTIEGGTVIKYTNNYMNASSITVHSNLLYQTAPYRPAIFTSKDDNSVGERIPGSTGSPGLVVYSTYLYWKLGGTASNLRMAYSWNGFTSDVADQEVWDCQFVNCSHPLTALATTTTMGLHNVLMTMDGSINNTSNPCSCPPAGVTVLSTTVHCYGENITADLGSKYFALYYIGVSPGINTSFSLTNSIVIAASVNPYTWGGSPTSITTSNNAVYYTNSLPAGVFQTVGAGHYYLADNTYRNQGVTNINTNLLTDLQTKTTYPPIIYSNVTASTNTTLFPQAQRDTDTPDLGYNYDPIDYVVDRYSITNATLTLTNGVAIASYNENGIQMQDGSSIISIGSPVYPNWFVRYNSVQEYPIALGGTNLPSGLTVSAAHLAATGPTGQYRFSKFACPAVGGYLFYNTGMNAYSSLLIQDSELWGGPVEFGGNTNTVTTLLNSLFERSSFSATSTPASSLWVTNNLFFGTTVVFWNQAATNTWQAFDNAFDSCTITTNALDPHPGYLTNGYNAYLNCTHRLNPVGSTDFTNNTTMAYQPGLLGTFYQPSSSPLINIGSTNAQLLGLYHYTTQTNQTKETTSLVDIGYHYVAVDGSGNPIDTVGSGVPDYLKDANGNGTVDSGEINWQDINDLGLRVIITRPKNNSVIP